MKEPINNDELDHFEKAIYVFKKTMETDKAILKNTEEGNSELIKKSSNNPGSGTFQNLFKPSELSQQANSTLPNLTAQSAISTVVSKSLESKPSEQSNGSVDSTIAPVISSALLEEATEIVEQEPINSCRVRSYLNYNNLAKAVNATFIALTTGYGIFITLQYNNLYNCHNSFSGRLLGCTP